MSNENPEPEPSADDESILLLDRYLGRLADDKIKSDPESLTAYKLGAACALLANLLELYEYPQAALTRRMFEEWRAELPSAEPSAEGAGR